MMRKNRNRNNEAFLKIILTSICLMSISLALSSCTLFDHYEHMRCWIYQTDVIFEDSKGNRYFDIGTGTNNFCKYVNDKNRYYRDYDYSFFYDDNQTFNYEFSVSNSYYLFACLRPGKVKKDNSDFVNNKRFIRIFDKDFQVINNLFYNEHEVLDLACSSNYLYICIENQNTKEIFLDRYDIKEAFVTTIIHDIKDGDSYDDSDINLFFKKDGGKQYGQMIGIKTDKTRLLGSAHNLFTDRIDLSFTDDNIFINWYGEKFSFINNYSFTDFYEKAFLIGDKIVFATYKNVYTSLCTAKESGRRCICGLQGSFLYEFDATSKSLSLLNKFDCGTYLVDYGIDNVRYYYNGGLYVNGTLDRLCETIEAEPSPKNDGPSSETKYCLSFYQGNFYGI